MFNGKSFFFFSFAFYFYHLIFRVVECDVWILMLCNQQRNACDRLLKMYLLALSFISCLFCFFSHFVFVLSASCFGFWWWTSTVARIFISTIYPYTRTVSIAFFLYMYCERHTHTCIWEILMKTGTRHAFTNRLVWVDQNMWWSVTRPTVAVSLW